MSLLRLLTTGRSWVGMDNDGIRYHALDPRAMPKFGGKKNPFRATAPKVQNLEFKVQSSEHGVPAAVVAVGREVPKPRPAPRRGFGVGAWLCGVAAKISGLFSRSPMRVKAAVPQFAKPPTQAELSLDSVKVVRNDLSDADLEVKQAKLPEAKTEKSKAEPQAASRKAQSQTSAPTVAPGSIRLPEPAPATAGRNIS